MGVRRPGRRSYSSRYNKRYGKAFDEEREEDPNAPGMRGSNYFVKKTPHGDIRRHYPEEEEEEGGVKRRGRTISSAVRRSGGTLAHEMKMKEEGRGGEEEGTQESRKYRSR